MQQQLLGGSDGSWSQDPNFNDFSDDLSLDFKRWISMDKIRQVVTKREDRQTEQSVKSINHFLGPYKDSANKAWVDVIVLGSDDAGHG